MKLIKEEAKKLFDPLSEARAQTVLSLVETLIKESSYNSGYVLHFIVNALYCFSEGVAKHTPSEITGAPCSGLQWIMIAQEINEKLAQYIKIKEQL
jgi:hypothetical protein